MTRTSMMMRWAWLAVAVVALSACSSSDSKTSASDSKTTVDPAASAAEEAARQQKDCADPEWKAAHLGVWYSVCRPNTGFR
ncbi:MAG TPA: hypothetical protein VGP50_00200 [Stellaceae bacterium]|jgi:ABC-type glycerol-3-phosphate transport system substrate-binding protein|nr:hypothetical protein [Stellaceae bacterium]